MNIRMLHLEPDDLVKACSSKSRSHWSRGENNSELGMLSELAVHLVVPCVIAQQHALEVSSNARIDILTGKV